MDGKEGDFSLEEKLEVGLPLTPEDVADYFSVIETRPQQLFEPAVISSKDFEKFFEYYGYLLQEYGELSSWNTISKTA